MCFRFIIVLWEVKKKTLWTYIPSYDGKVRLKLYFLGHGNVYLGTRVLFFFIVCMFFFSLRIYLICRSCELRWMGCVIKSLKKTVKNITWRRKRMFDFVLFLKVYFSSTLCVMSERKWYKCNSGYTATPELGLVHSGTKTVSARVITLSSAHRPFLHFNSSCSFSFFTK